MGDGAASFKNFACFTRLEIPINVLDEEIDLLWELYVLLDSKRDPCHGLGGCRCHNFGIMTVAQWMEF